MQTTFRTLTALLITTLLSAPAWAQDTTALDWSQLEPRQHVCLELPDSRRLCGPVLAADDLEVQLLLNGQVRHLSRSAVRGLLLVAPAPDHESGTAVGEAAAEPEPIDELLIELPSSIDEEISIVGRRVLTAQDIPALQFGGSAMVASGSAVLVLPWAVTLGQLAGQIGQNLATGSAGSIPGLSPWLGVSTAGGLILLAGGAALLERSGQLGRGARLFATSDGIGIAF